MTLKRCTSPALLTFALLILPAAGIAQANSAPAPNQRESVQDLAAKLSPQQKQQLDDSIRAYRERRFADALALQKQLLKDLPGDTIISKYASEAALNAGDNAFALATLKGLVQADPDDWQAVAMLTRACAGSGDKAGRDAGMARMLDLHNRGVTPARMKDFIVEKIDAGQGSLAISQSFVPWGIYNVYATGRLTDNGGNLIMSISLECDDGDQPSYARQHPDDAAKGARRFSLNAYKETGLNAAGQRTQTHYTYKFIDGLPPEYETIREEFLRVASGKSEPISSRSGLVVQ